MTIIKLSKLISEEVINDVANMNGSILPLKGRSTGATTGHVLVVIGSAMENPEIKQPLCTLKAKYIADMTDYILNKLGFDYFKITKDHNGYYLTYEIFKMVNSKDYIEKPTNDYSFKIKDE